MAPERRCLEQPWFATDGLEHKLTMTATSLPGVTGVPLLGSGYSYTATVPSTDTNATLSYSIRVSDGYTSDTTPTWSVLVYEPATGG